MNTYSDYFEIDKGYKPEINPNSIKDKETRWMDTFPHKTFIDLLKRLERMLGRENSLNKHSIWIQGAYGTGKSRIAWTLDNLLTCSPEELEEYFDTYDDLRYENDLRQKLLGHKQGTIVTAYKYSSSEIDSTDALIAAVFNTLTEAFEKANITYNNGGTQRGRILEWLKDEENRSYLDNIIHKAPYCHEGCFAGQTADGILARLQGNEKVDELIKGILKVLKKRGVNCLPTTMEDLTAWIRETILANQLKALVFIWDEFSDYFKQNRTRLGSLQKLAELSDEIPFNLIIVTHFSGSILPEGDQTSKIIQDRFSPIQEIKMPESIAFQLIGHALKVKKEHEKEWELLADDLNDCLKESRPKVAKMLKGVDENLLKKMLPFQPYAALVLKNIANLFDSNQRSMFNFISDTTPDLHAFQWFIKEHGPESDTENILSIDMLWDYFYKTGHGHEGVGRSNLDMMVASILDVFPREESKLDNLEQRVLKIVLMFQALAKKTNNSPEFLATEENLRLAFDGIPDLEFGKGIMRVNALVKKGVLFLDELAGKKVFQAPMNLRGRDMEEIEKLKQKTLSETKTKDLIGNFSEMVFTLPLSLKNRFIMRRTGPEAFKTTLNQLINEEDHDYRMKLLLVFAKDENDAFSAQANIKSALQEPRANGVIFLDATSVTLTPDEWEKWGEASAKASYYLAKDEGQAKNALQAAKNIIARWEKAIREGSFTLFTYKNPDGISCTQAQKVLDELQLAVSAKYPLTFDFTPGMSEALFKTATSPFILAGIVGRTHLKGSSCGLTPEQENNLLKEVKECPEYWKKFPSLPISQLKKEVDKMTANAFAPGSEGRIAIGTIVDALIKKGFMPNNLSAYLTGFLLKEYAAGEYRYSDGENSEPMDNEKLVKLIFAYFKKLNGTEPRYHDCFIEVLTEEQRLFANLAKEVFNLHTNSSIDAIVAQICGKVKDFQYPLWCFSALPESVTVERFIKQFTLLLNPVNASVSNSGAIATEIGRLIQEQPEAEAVLKGIFTKEKAQEAMSLWLDGFENGEFRRAAAAIEAIDPLKDVRLCFSADGVWLWNQATGEEEIHKVLRDYRIVEASTENGFVTKTNNLQDCLKGWNEKAKTLKMPYSTLIVVRKELKVFLSLLQKIAMGNNLEINEHRDKFLEEITTHAILINDFFNEKYNLFKSTYDVQLSGLDDSEVDSLYAELGMSSFIQEKAVFEKELAVKIEDIKKHQARGKLLALWKEKTGTESPAEWSELYKTPILVMMDTAHFADAKFIFDTINEKNASGSSVERAFEILQLHPEILENLTETPRIDHEFRQKLLERYAVVLPDLASVREKLKQNLKECSVYGWYGHPRLKEVVKKLAQSEYTLHKADDLKKRIDDMKPEVAKDYLKRLIANQFEIGIEILSEK